MQHPFLLFIIICIFCGSIGNLIEDMIDDQNTVIRFLGYLISIVMAILALVVVLYCFFDVKLFNLPL